MKPILNKLFLALIAALTLRACAVETFRVSGAAMVPAVVPGDVIFTSKLHYGIRVPGSGSLIWQWSKARKGDVVVLGGVGEPPMTVIRRIVALPGESVKVEHGNLFLKEGGDWHQIPCAEAGESAEFCRVRFDQREVLVRETKEGVEGGETHRAEFKLTNNEIFVISDDRRDGPDSRHFGPVPLEAIIGKVLSVWIPAKAPNKEFAVDKVLPIKINERGYFTPVL